jgi:hypothetical protein
VEIDISDNKEELDGKLKVGGPYRVNWFLDKQALASWEMKVLPPAGSAPKVKPVTDDTPTADNNRIKLEIHQRFADMMMKQVGAPVYLFGGAAVNVAVASPRRINDLDYRTSVVGKFETETWRRSTQRCRQRSRSTKSHPSPRTSATATRSTAPSTSARSPSPT